MVAIVVNWNFMYFQVVQFLYFIFHRSTFWSIKKFALNYCLRIWRLLPYFFVTIFPFDLIIYMHCILNSFQTMIEANFEMANVSDLFLTRKWHVFPCQFCLLTQLFVVIFFSGLKYFSIRNSISQAEKRRRLSSTFSGSCLFLKT